MPPDTDKKYMRMAIALAKKGEGMTSPNPSVGAVIVKSGKVIGRGYHKFCGGPHAEIYALNEAGAKARGATLYVTLEPCDHFGRTPPCTDAIITSGIKKVFISMKDPNPINSGRGIKKLNRYGINTSTGILKDEAMLLNKPYIKLITTRMPYVTVKIAESLDGKIATRTGDSKWISCESSRRYVHKLRRSADAVMVGVNTLIRDDPMLLSNAAGKRQPIRIIVDSRFRTPLSARIFSNRESRVIIATTRNVSRKISERYESRGASILIVKRKGRRVDLKDLMKVLGRMNIMNVLVEGGGELIAGLMEGCLVDKFLFFIAPKIIGGRNAPTSVEGIGAGRMKDAFMFGNIRLKRFGQDILVEAGA